MTLLLYSIRVPQDAGTRDRVWMRRSPPPTRQLRRHFLDRYNGDTSLVGFPLQVRAAGSGWPRPALQRRPAGLAAPSYYARFGRSRPL